MQRRTFLAGATVTAATGLVSAEPAAQIRPPGDLERLLFARTMPAAALAPDVAATRLTAAACEYAASRYATVARALPDLLAGLHTAHGQSRGDLRNAVAGLLARAYVLASSLCTKLGDDAIGWVLADRALVAAQETGDGVLEAAAAHTVAIAMRREGHHGGAITLLTETARHLGADAGDATPALLGAYGNLLCTAAYSSAQAGNRGEAATFLSEAVAAAARLDRPAAGVVPFSRSTVNIYKIGIFTALGNTPAALEAARLVRVAELPSSERYGRYCIDTARAWQAHGNVDHAVQALLAAERHAPEEVHRPSVRDLVTGLLYAPTATPEGLRGLANRLGVAS